WCAFTRTSRRNVRRRRYPPVNGIGQGRLVKATAKGQFWMIQDMTAEPEPEPGTRGHAIALSSSSLVAPAAQAARDNGDQRRIHRLQPEGLGLELGAESGYCVFLLRVARVGRDLKKPLVTKRAAGILRRARPALRRRRARDRRRIRGCVPRRSRGPSRR